MSSSVLAINFAYADGSAKGFSMGPFNVNSISVMEFKNRVQNLNQTDTQEQKKITNLFAQLKSENGAEITGIKSATITTSQTRRIFDAATYTPT